LSRRHLSNHDRLFPGCKERVDFPENLLEGLPATVCGSPVVPIDPRSNLRRHRLGSTSIVCLLPPWMSVTFGHHAQITLVAPAATKMS
jgi:hypothetical protein